MHKRLAAIGVLLTFFLVGPTAARAQETPCYPRPCASSATLSSPGRAAVLEPTVGATAEVPAHRRSSAPFVVAGLLMVSLSLALIIASRRVALARTAIEVASGDTEVGRGGAYRRPIPQLTDAH